MNERNLDAESRDARFTTTHWTVVLAAARTESPSAQQALAELCERYWYPLYAFARRKGSSPHDAEDRTQQFFAGRVITKKIFRGINPGMGRFRTWMLNSFQNFLCNEWERERTLKRGGFVPHESLDAHEWEARYVSESSCEATPEQFFDRAWATTLFREALDTLRAEYKKDGALPLYEELLKFLPGAQATPAYVDLAARLNLSEAALKMRVVRLKRELGQVLRREVKRTVSSPDEIEQELSYLFSVLSA